MSSDVMPASTGTGETKPREASAIKCLVWDLDHTLWDGILLEDQHVTPRPQVEEIIKTLDSRGILLSIASKNDHDQAMGRLRELGLDQYFLYPQISWNSKAASIRAIASSINIGLDAVAFIDDQAFERDEVRFSLPEVRCLDAGELAGLLAMPELNPRFLTADSSLRRLMYLSDIERQRAEQEFVGAPEAFLATLGMRLAIAPAQEGDLERAEELTVRTHQLNTTGYTYSYEELDYFRTSPQHKLLIAELEDTYGTYGKIGLTLIECQPHAWTIKLLLMSCRVMSRGVGAVLISHIMRMAQAANVKLRAEFVTTSRNRMMYITYKFIGFREISTGDGVTVLENDLSRIPPFPDYMSIEIRD